MYYAPIYRVQLIRERSIPYEERPQLTHPDGAAALFRGYFFGADRERFAVAMLDTKHRFIGIHPVSEGSLSASLVHPREVFTAPILRKAAALLLGHNHPSGDPTPSPEDRELTLRLVQCGELLGIRILDHLIIGEGTRFVSFQREHLL
jgi:DNA repair protein RadC